MSLIVAVAIVLLDRYGRKRYSLGGFDLCPLGGQPFA